MKLVYVGLLMIGAAFSGALFMKWQTSRPTTAPVITATAAPAPVAPPPTVVIRVPSPLDPPVAKPRPVTDEPRPVAAQRRKVALHPALHARKIRTAAPPTAPVEISANIAPSTPRVETTTPPPPPVAAPEPPPPAAEPTRPIENTQPEPAPAPPLQVTLTAGTLLTVRTSEGLSSDRNQAGDTFTATLDQPLVVDGYVIAERGARVEGRVVSAQRAGRVRGLADLSVELFQLKTSDGQRVPIETETFVRRSDESQRQDAAKIGAGAARAGGDGKSAAIGARAGGAAGAGTVLTTRGRPAVMPAETRISFRVRNTVTLTERRTASRL